MGRYIINLRRSTRSAALVYKLSMSAGKDHSQPYLARVVIQVTKKSVLTHLGLFIS